MNKECTSAEVFAYLWFYSIYESTVNWIIIYSIEIVQYYCIFYKQLS